MRERQDHLSRPVRSIRQVGILFSFPYKAKCLRRSDLASLSNLSSRFFRSTCSLSDNELLPSVIHKDLPNVIVITFPVALKHLLVFNVVKSVCGTMQANSNPRQNKLLEALPVSFINLFGFCIQKWFLYVAFLYCFYSHVPFLLNEVYFHVQYHTVQYLQTSSFPCVSFQLRLHCS